MVSRHEIRPKEVGLTILMSEAFPNIQIKLTVFTLITVQRNLLFTTNLWLL